jgi:hypothetical protein
MVALDPETGEREHGTATSETRRILENLKPLLASAGSLLDRLVTNRIFIGINKTIELPTGGCLVIEDEVRTAPRACVFDPMIHCFNSLRRVGSRTFICTRTTL